MLCFHYIGNVRILIKYDIAASRGALNKHRQIEDSKVLCHLISSKVQQLTLPSCKNAAYFYLKTLLTASKKNYQ